jgi:putative transposase
MKYASYKDRKTMARDLRPIYTPPTVEAAQLAMDHFAKEWDPGLRGQHRNETEH